MADLLLPLGLAYLMLVVGLETPARAFTTVLAAPGAVAAGFLAQMIALPVLAFALAIGLRLTPETAIGLVIVAAAPGGVTAGFVTTLLKGDAALSVILTVLTSLAALVSVPLVVGGAMSHFGAGTVRIALPVGAMLATLVVTTALPLALALVARRLAPEACRRLLPALRRIAQAVFAAIIAGAVVAQWRAIVAEGATIAVAVVLLNTGAIATGWLVAAAAGLNDRRRRAVATECGLQNVALALTVAGPILGRPDLGGPATVYAFVMNATIVALLLMRPLLGRLTKIKRPNPA